MAYFPDLTEYNYFEHSPATKNVGWLAQGHPFPTAAPTEALLDRLWAHCRIPVMQSRGLHRCEFCSPDVDHDVYGLVSRSSGRVRLGSAEIRVIGNTGATYAAPTLIYHYVSVHYYAPPAEFVTALMEGIDPASDAYRAKLQALELDELPTPTAYLTLKHTKASGQAELVCIHLPAGWHHEPDTDHFDAELRRELSPGHPLHGVAYQALAYRSDRDDVLFGAPTGELAVVHLTWRGKREQLPWPKILWQLRETFTERVTDLSPPFVAWSNAHYDRD